MATSAIAEAESYASGTPWTRVIWDVVAVAWLLNDEDQFMKGRIIPTRIPDYNSLYDVKEEEHPMTYVYYVKRDCLMRDLIEKLTK